MANKAQFDVVINAVGHLEKAIKELRTMGSETTKTTKNTKELSKAQDEVNYKLNQGVTGVSASARSFSKLTQTIGDGPNGLVGAYATLAANAFAVTAAFSTLREAAQVEQMMKGLEVQGGRTGLALKTVASNLQELTGYSISAADAMKTVSLMGSAGFSTSAMEGLTTVATNAALALGRNVPDALDRISKGVTKLEPELLDELGIMTKLSEAQSKYALENNKSAASLTSYEKRQAMLNAVLAEGELKFGGLSEQVEANPFDKLAAGFSDLMKNILSIVNTIAGPLAAIFSNQGMLFGAIILFGATIRKQLMPALYLMGKVSREMRDEHLKEAESIRDTARANLESARAAKIAAIEKKKATLLGAESRAIPKGFDIQAAASGQLDTKAVEKESSRLQKSIESREKNLADKQAIWSKDKRDQKQAEINQIKAAKAALEDLYSTQNAGEDSLLAKQAASKKSNLEFYSRKRLAQAADLKSQAVESAYAGKVTDAWKQAAQSVNQYKKAVENESRSRRVGEGGVLEKQGLLGKSLDATKVLGARVSTFASVGAAAFMRFIPYVGIAATALSGAWAVYENFIKSDAAKAHDEALRKLKQTIDQTAESVKQYNRINNSSAPIGIRTAEALTLQSNAAATLVDAFKEVENAQKTLTRDSSKVDSFFEALIGGQDAMVSYQTGLSQSDDMFSAAKEAYGGDTARNVGMVIGAAIGTGLGAWVGGPIGGAIGFDLGLAIGGGLATWVQGVLPEELNGIDEAALESARAVSQLTKIIGKDLADNYIKAAGGSEKLAASPALRTTFIKAVGDAYVGVADAVKSLQEAFSQTGTSITEFFNNAIPKTPFDGMVKGYEAVNKAFRELDGTIAGSNIEEQVKLMTSMPQEMRRLLTPDQSATLKNLEQQQALLDANRDAIQRIVDLGEEASNSEKANLEVLKTERGVLESQLTTLAQGGEAIRQKLRDTQETLINNQSTARSYENQLKLINAIASANSDIYSKSVAGEKARIQRHNEAIRLQQAQLKIQVNLQEIYIQQQEIAIQQLETKLDILKATRDIGVEEANNNKISAASQKTERLLNAQAEGVTAGQIASINSVLTNIVAGNRLATSTISTASMEFATEEARAAAQAYATAALQFEQQNQVAIAAIDLTERKAAIRELRENITSLRTSISALDQTIIGSAEEAVLLRRMAQELSNESAARENEILNLTNENLQTQEKINDTLTARQNILKTNLSNIMTSAAAERVTMRQEAGHNIAMLRLEKERIQARASRMGRGPELTAANEAVQNLDRQIDQEITLNSLRQERQRLTIQQNILEQIAGNGFEDSISRYQESLELRRKEVELTSQLAEKQTEIAQNAGRISLARIGATPDERTQRAFEWETAERVYEIARAERDLKMASIDAEYALLDYKKDVDAQNLRTQVYLLRSFNQIFNSGRANPELEAIIGNINAAANNLDSVNTQGARLLARQSVEADLVLARQRADLARATYEGSNLPRGAAAQAAQNLVVERQAVLRAQRTRFEDRGGPQDSLRDTTTRIGQDLVDANKPIVDVMTAVNTELTTIREAIIPAAQAVVAAATDTSDTGVTSGMTAEQMTRQMFDYAKSAYSDVTVNRLGVKSGHGTGSLHYDDRAFDINAVGGVDARDPRAKARLDQIAADLSTRGMEVLWNGFIYRAGIAVARIPSEEGQHYDHLHAEVDDASYRRMRRMYESMDSGVLDGAARAAATPIPVAPATESAPQTTLRAANDNQRAPVVSVLGEMEEQWNSYIETIRQASLAEMNVLLANLPLIEVKRDLFGELVDELPGAMRIATVNMEEMSASLSKSLGQDFGPSGEVVKSLMGVMTTLSTSIPQTLTTLGASFDEWQAKQSDAIKGLSANTQQTIYQAERLSAAFSTAAQIIGSIAGLLKSASDAKIAGIDREIAAEQKRDGRSAASVAKIGELEKKKDAMARKSFNVQKKLMLAQAVMSTAAAVTSTLASMSAIALPPVPAIMAGIVGALGLAQVAIISGMQYGGGSGSSKSPEMPTTLSVGKRSDTVDLARGPNASAGGEVGYLRGASGSGSNASNYRTIGSAYGGELMRGYGNRGFVVGEKGPEVITPETPISVTPANDVGGAQPINASFNIHAIDSQGVQDVLVAQKGNIIKMLREAANASGKSFMEDVNVNVYTRPSVGKL